MDASPLLVAIALEHQMFRDALTSALCPRQCDLTHVIRLDEDELDRHAEAFDLVITSPPASSELRARAAVLEVSTAGGGMAGFGTLFDAVTPDGRQVSDMSELVHYVHGGEVPAPRGVLQRPDRWRD